MPAGITYFFACQHWFSLDKDDGLIERDLYPSEEDSHGQLCSYLTEVHTSTVQGAGTDADVSLMLFGDLGDSGLQPLNVSHINVCCFFRGYAVASSCFEIVTSSAYEPQDVDLLMHYRPNEGRVFSN